MKIIKNIRLLLLISIISISYSCKAQLTQVEIQDNLTNLNSNLMGIWINEEDSNWKIEFNSNGKCYWYYTDEDTDIFSYSILTISPQCGKNVKTED